MKIGTMDGLIDGLSQVVYDSGELTSADTSITISGLTGNTAEEYILIYRFVSDYAAAAVYGLRPNNDSGSNYGFQRLRGRDSTPEAIRATPTSFALTTGLAQNSLTMGEANLYAKSGYVRTLINFAVDDVVGTTIDKIASYAESWTNTADEITSLVVFADNTDGIGIGSRIILLKKVDVSSDMKTGAIEVQGEIENAWQKIYTNDLPSAAASVTISGLTGNTDILYKLICRFKDKDTVGGYFFRPNSDSTADKYGYQFLRGADAAVSASRDITQNRMDIGYTNTDQYYCFSKILLYAKSGYVRTAITKYLEDTTATSVFATSLNGSVWNDTSTEITSLEISAAADQMEIGTHIELWKLNL